MDRRSLIKYVCLFTVVAVLAIQKPVFSQVIRQIYLPALNKSWVGYFPYISNAPIEPTSTPLPAGTPPSYSTSYYMLTVDGVKSYNLGCQLGAKDRDLPGVQDTIVILDYGSPKVWGDVYGTDLFWMTDATIAQITASVENFGRGYFLCSGADSASQIYVAIGTTNYWGNPAPSTATVRAHGRAWAEMVNAVNAWLIANGFSSQVHAVGATDIELSWSSVAVGRAWVDGYDEVNLYDYYDFGAAEGCATRRDPNRHTCGNGWTREDVWYKAYGTRPAYPLPEIYASSGVNAEQWALISVYSANTRGYGMEFHGVLTQWQACVQSPGQCDYVDNLPWVGWTQLYNELKRDPRTFYTPKWSSDMVWGYNAAADLPAAKDALPLPADLPQRSVESLQKALDIPTLDVQMRSSLEEKLANAKRLFADTQAGQARPAAKQAHLAPQAPPVTDGEFKSGIFDGPGGMVHAWEGSMINHWQGMIDGEHWLVSAGARADDPTQGVVMVVRVAADRLNFSRTFYSTPTRNGAVTILAAQGSQLRLQSAAGDELLFDMIQSTFH